MFVMYFCADQVGGSIDQVRFGESITILERLFSGFSGFAENPELFADSNLSNWA